MYLGGAIEMIADNIAKLLHLSSNWETIWIITLVIIVVYNLVIRLLIKRGIVKESATVNGIICALVSCLLVYQTLFHQEWPLSIFAFIFLVLTLYYFRKVYLERKKEG